jgi:hypothetical protein
MNRRLPGQSIRDQKEKLTDNRLIPYYFATVFAWLLWAWESYKARMHLPPKPRLLLFLAVAATGLTIIVFGRLYKRFRNLNRGERGELRVAEALDELRAYGYRPVHDIVGKNSNIDHVLVGPAGVFAIETKFRTGTGVISFRDGEGLFVGGFPEEKDCLKQARGNAAHVNRLIQQSCGRWEWVKPIVVFVGDWRVTDDWGDTDARVFTPDRLVRYIINQQPELKRSEIELIASHLERTAKV